MDGNESWRGGSWNISRFCCKWGDILGCLVVNNELIATYLFLSLIIGQILYDENHRVIGVATNDMGVAKDGSKRETFQRGVELKGMHL